MNRVGGEKNQCDRENLEEGKRGKGGGGMEEVKGSRFESLFIPRFVRNERVGGGKNCEERRVKGNEKTVALWGRHRTIISLRADSFSTLSLSLSLLLSSQVRGFIQQLGRTWPRIIDIACNVTFQSSNDVGMLQKGLAEEEGWGREGRSLVKYSGHTADFAFGNGSCFLI